MAPHLFIIHFPIALIVAGAFLELVGVALSDSSYRVWGSRFIIAGGVAAFLGFLSGVLLWLLGTFALSAVATVFADAAGALVPAVA